MARSRSNQQSSSVVRAMAAGLGFVAGLRSQLPFALLATAANGGQFARTSSKPLALLRSRGALVVLALAANGEIVADKLPFTPKRIGRAPLAGRLLCGGIVGTAICGEAGQSAALGAILGAA